MIRDQYRSTAAGFGELPDIIRRQTAWRNPEQYGAPGVLGCPLCRRPIPLPDNCDDGSRPMAECLQCDLYFDPCDAEACFRSGDPG